MPSTKSTSLPPPQTKNAPPPTRRGYYRGHLFLPEFPFTIWLGTEEASMGEHAHEFSELMIILGGHATHLINGVESRAEAGDVFLFQGPDRHGFILAPGVKFQICNIAYEPAALLLPMLADLRQHAGFQAMFMLEPHYQDPRNFQSFLRLSDDSLRTVAVLLQDMEREYQQRDDGWQAWVRARFLQLVVLLARLYGRRNADSGRLATRLAGAFAHVETHFRQRLELAELAQLAAICPGHFIRMFKKHYGVTPAAYIKRRRVDHAKQLLATGKCTVSAAALASGFTDSNYFARAFREVTGQTPRECLPKRSPAVH